MRQATYSIQKTTKDDSGSKEVTTEISRSSVEADLEAISLFDISGTYVLPRAETKVDIYDDDEKITLKVGTSREAKVEKSLRYFLDSFSADYEGNGRDIMRKGEEPEPTSKSGDCFIATEVYGDSHHRNVETLREYRDRELSQSPVGRRFTDWYYGGGGEKAASLVRRIPLSKRVIRVGLDVFATRFRADSEDPSRG